METSVEAQIRDGSIGQMVAGGFVLQVNPIHGDLVTPAGEPILPRARPRPISVLPPPFPNLIDRESDLATVWETLRAAIPVEVYGAPGVGKTALARHVAHDPASAGFADGVIWLPVQRAVDDLLQSLFDELFESDIRYKPSDGEIRRGLQTVRAGVLLDDLDLAPDQVALLTDVAPACSLVLTSAQRHLWDKGRSIELHGLGRDDAVLLVERVVDQQLGPEDRQAVEQIVTAVHGNPRALLVAAALPQAVAQMPAEQTELSVAPPPRTLAEVAALVQTENPIAALDRQMVETLPQHESRALTVLAAFPGVSVAAEHVGALADLDAPAPVLGALEGRHLVDADGKQYRAVESVGAIVRRDSAVAAMQQQALAYFISVAEAQQRTPARLVPDHGAIASLVQSALDTQRWAEALRLARAAEGSIALVGHWALWGQVLGWTLEVARRVDDRASEAWALHQLGTRALCLGDAATASSLLTEALGIREAHEDEIGAAATHHNLGFLAAPPPPRKRGPSTAEKVGIAALAILLALLAGAVVAASAGWRPFGTSPAATPTVTVGPTSTVAPTGTSVPTSAPTVTPVPAQTVTPVPAQTSTPVPAPTSTPVPAPTSTATPHATSTLQITLLPTPHPTA